MARLTSTAQGGYYPFPEEHLPAIASLFQPAPSGNGGLTLDPCAGEGAALATLAKVLGLTPYANELDTDRAAACRERFGLTQAVEGDLLQLRTSHNAYTLQWVNPPYTQNKDGDERRREFEYLQHAWQWTQPGGFTLWAVYAQHMTERAARFLLENSSHVDVYRVPGLHLGAYPQIVVVARKAGDKRDVTGEAVLALAASCQQPDNLAVLEARDEAVYRLPAGAKVRRFHFHPDDITPEVMLPALAQFGAQASNSFQAVVAPPPPAPPLTPIVPPRGGQLGLILAAGLFDGLLLNIDGQQAAVRGVSRMVEVNTTPPELEGVHETYEIRPQVTVSLLQRNGEVQTIAGENEVALVRFLKDHREALLAYLDEHSAPVYDFDYHHLDSVFDKVFRNRRLPGRPVTGLFETQKHVVAAAYAALLRRKGVIIVGEMGSGKSAMGAALAGALHARGDLKPGEVAVVMCPPHLVNKWARELQDAVPGSVVEIVTDVDDTTTFMAEAAQQPDRLHVMVLSRERAKLGEGWQPATITRKQYNAQWRKGGTPPYHLNGKPRVVTRKLLCCPTCGDPIPTRKDLSGAASVTWLKQQPRTCYRCGAALWQLTRRWSGPREGEKFPRRNPRYPLARLLRERYPDRVGVVLVDELHETKSGGSDQGRAMQDLVGVARKAIGLTGTLFGGKASTVFWLEWAFNPRMVDHYPLDAGQGAAINRWVRATGVLERVVEYKEDEASSGSYTTTKRVEYAPQEAPGISPRLVAELIDHCLWVSLADLNFALPDYEEIPVAVELPGDVQSEYERGKKKLLDYLLACRTDGDASFLSTYLQAALRYPSSCFREKDVVHRLAERGEDNERLQRHVTTLKGFGEQRLYSKESELCELLKRELAEGRRCVVFVAQTGTLDIQPRLEALIRQHIPAAKPFILRSSSPATDKRDAYLEQRLKAGHNILICNPRLVQTGFDLVAFPTLIFYETDYSLYVMSQAARRAWRIGQSAACRTYYLFYADTMEAQAIDLISRKQAAAALLGGDADGGGLAQLAGGSNSLLAELARAVAEDEAVVDVTRLFRHQAEQSEDFTSGWAANVAVAEHEQTSEFEDVETATQENATPRNASVQTTSSDVSAAYAQVQRVKQQHPQALVLVEVDDFCEAFGQDATRLADALDLVQTSRTLDGERVSMTGFPRHMAQRYLAQLSAQGLRVALLKRNSESPKPASSPQSTTPSAAPATQPDPPPVPEVAATTSGPHADLIGRTFLDPQGRAVTVSGPARLFAETDVTVTRDGKTYTLRADVLRGYRPASEALPGPGGEQQAPLTPGQQRYADLVDEGREPAVPELYEGVAVERTERDPHSGRVIKHLADGTTVELYANGIAARRGMLDVAALSQPRKREANGQPALL